MQNFLNFVEKNYTLLISIISISLIILISFIFQTGWKGFGEYAANLLIITILIGPLFRLWNKKIKNLVLKYTSGKIDHYFINKIINIINKIFQILLKYRRQLGITTFWLAAIHGISYGTIFFLQNNKLFILSNPPIYGIFGIITLLLLFIGFITSNNFSQKLLGKNWKLIQTFSTYGALLFLSLHLNFMEFGEGFGYLLVFIFLIVLKFYKI